MFFRQKNKIPERKILTENRDYMFVPNLSDDSHYSIKIMSGDYEGVVYYYQTIEVKEEKNEAKFTFQYNIEEDLDLVTDMQHFENHIADILHSILTTLDSSQYEVQYKVQYEDEVSDEHTKINHKKSITK